MLSAMSSVSDTDTASSADSFSTPSSAAPAREALQPCRFSLFLMLEEILGRGFLNTGSSDGLRSLAILRPGSACSFSRDGEGLMDLDEELVGKGSLEARRGIPLGRYGDFCR